MEFRDINDSIKKTLIKEYNDSPIIGWSCFIEKKDLGVAYNNVASHHNVYYIIDDKKWVLARLKYGI